MTACTGSPTLANNVTQAQAFCIATACLQVPVSETADSALKMADRLAALDRTLIAGKPHQYSSHEANFRRHDLFEGVSDEWATERVSSSDSLVPLRDAQISGESTPSPASLLTTIATEKMTSQNPLSDPASSATPAVMVSEESQMISYPDFNRMHAAIHTDLIRRLNSSGKRPSWLPFRLTWSYPADRAPLGAGLMRTISMNLATKKASWHSLFQPAGKKYQAQVIA